LAGGKGGGLLKLVYFPPFWVWLMLIPEFPLGKCVLGSGRGLYFFGRTEKTMKNFRQIFSDVAETDTVHLLCVTTYSSALCHCTNSCTYTVVMTMIMISASSY
jgi:hypothetical protein